MGFFPTTLNMGVVNDPNLRVELAFQSASRNFQARFGTSGSQAAVAIPAGAELKFITQCKNAPTLPAVAVDAGSGLGAFDTGAPAFTAYSNQTLTVGHPSAQPFCVVLEVKIASKLRTLSEMLTL
jgi:hypothetical protein